jgi:hypothetical protein
MGHIQLSTEWIPGSLSRGHGRRSVKLTNHVPLVSRIRKSGALPPVLLYDFVTDLPRYGGILTVNYKTETTRQTCAVPLIGP